MKNTFSISFFLALFFCSCGSPAIKDIEWIVGHWQGLDENDLTFHEVWERSGKNEYAGSGATLSPEGDTLWKETLKIGLVEGTPYYIATLPENKGPVLFKMIKGDARNAIFENREHDFPQRISYVLETDSTINVRLEGIEKGQPRIETLNFVRVKADNIRPTGPRPVEIILPDTIVDQ
ncbi:MAG TPA: DUF6265 family protein [Bacteroidia bacterium]|nr:DUF6265 family protein [Bacteroidia bacterium]